MRVLLASTLTADLVLLALVLALARRPSDREANAAHGSIC
jgi:hypothetical protein